MPLRRRIAFAHRFASRPDDVFLCAFPRSGLTLLQAIVHQLRAGDDGGDWGELVHIDAAVPWLEMEALAGSYGFLAGLPSPRVLKTHLLRSFLPREARCVYLVRDVREVFVSSRHHLAMLTGHPPRPEAFFRLFDRGGNPHHGSWFDHLESWWPHRGDEGVLWLTYEGVLADLPGTVRRLAAFCGLPLDERRLPGLLERISLAAMWSHSALFDPRLRQVEPEVQPFIRQGRAGSWREELPAALAADLAGEAARLARRLGARGAAGEDPVAWLLRGEPCS